MADAPYTLPEDLTGHLRALSSSDLDGFETGLETATAALLDAGDNADPAQVAAFHAAYATLDAERAGRTAAAASRQALATRIAPPPPAVPEQVPQETVVAAARPTGGAQVEDIRAERRLNYSLAEAQSRTPNLPRAQQPAVLLAAAEVPGVATGSQLDGVMGLVEVMQAKARALQDGAPAAYVAQVRKTFRHMVGREFEPEQMAQVIDEATNPEALVAAGGWCSPSEITYDLFNIASAEGMLDLPRVGISRGGVKWPVSPSYANVIDGFAAIPTGSGLPLWSWTETQDAAAVTGTGQSGTKTCGRIPCVAFMEGRLSCDGICLTAGNLITESYPELVANYIDLLYKAHAHKMNAKRITQLVALSTASSAATGTPFTTGSAGVVAPLMGAISIAAVDYRARFAMARNAVLEVVLPPWVRDMMISDLVRRTGVDMLDVAESRLLRMFDARNVRVQWVDDWQVRSASTPGTSTAGFLTAWPTSVQFMIYAPGTFFLGEGLNLDLGVIRDSTLNATNDYTAAWTEECWLIGMRGHESRVYTVSICADGTTGAADLTACAL